MALTPKQESFARYVAEGKTQADAYRMAYDTTNSAPETIHNNAYALMRNSDISTRVEELKAQAAEAVALTIADLVRELEEARTIASTTETPQTSAMIQASMGKAKLLGFLKDKVENTGKDGGPMKFVIGWADD